MSDYTYPDATNFGTKDALPSGNAAKVIKGDEFHAEFNAIKTAVNSKSDKASPTFTGTLTAGAVTINGNLTATLDSSDTVTIDGGTY
jgi:hypothetical protein|tara:strand:+ start:854 stop:1114 length:261 start_codon:yes stop_codon:yes gene_type:complete